MGKIRKYYYKKILVDSEKISISSDIEYKALDILLLDHIAIESLLPNDYLVRRSNQKNGYCRVLIVKFNNRDEILTDLFKYKGKAFIMSCKLYDINSNYDVFVQNIRPSFWENLSSQSIYKTDKWWSTETTKYNHIVRNDRNDYYNYGRKKVEINKTTNVKTYKKIQGKKLFNIPLKDKKTDILGSLYTSNQILRNKETKEPYEGSYHYNFRTKKVMSGETNNVGGFELESNVRTPKKITIKGKAKSRTTKHRIPKTTKVRKRKTGGY